MYSFFMGVVLRVKDKLVFGIVYREFLVFFFFYYRFVGICVYGILFLDMCGFIGLVVDNRDYCIGSGVILGM